MVNLKEEELKKRACIIAEPISEVHYSSVFTSQDFSVRRNLKEKAEAKKAARKFSECWLASN